MEKSSNIVLSEEEKKHINSITKTAAEAEANDNVPERFKGWYTASELREIVNED